MPEIRSVLKKLLPNRLRTYEAIADAVLAKFKGTIAAEARDEPDEQRQAINLARALAGYRGIAQAATSAPGVDDKTCQIHLAWFYCLAVRATLGLTPFRVQLVAALALADGYLLEMGTGEGKTLVAPLAAFLSIARSKGQVKYVHVVTANEYLAQRDANQMASLYHALNLPVAVSLAGQDPQTKRQAYGHPVVYGTANVFALDLLHDDQVVDRRLLLMKGDLADTFAIVDEVDQVLIDEAKNPVVFSLSAPADAKMYAELLDLVKPLERGQAPARAGDDSDGDYWLDLENRSAVLTNRGYERIEAHFLATNPAAGAKALGAEYHQLVHLVTVALGALALLKRDVHYTVQNGRIVLIDTLTGRLLPGRRWDTGLQQLLEAKEGLDVTEEPVVRGRISLQNYFKLYGRLAGMSGTVLADAEEFEHVYGLRAVAVPPNLPSKRVDLPDRFVRTAAQKVEVVVEEVKTAQASCRPTLIVVSHADQANLVAAALVAEGYPVRVLTAANHSEEASILSRAGEYGAITIATSLAGRGVDIKLGGEGRQLLEHFQAIARAPRDELTPEERQAQQQRAVFLTERLLKATAEIRRHPYDLDFIEGPDVAFKAAEELAAALRYFDDEQPELEHARNAISGLLSLESFRRHHLGLAQHTAGLLVIGFEHFETERADQQLRGRAGRQGDAGTTLFLTSLEDTLLAETGSGEELRRLLHAVGAKAGDVLEEKLARKLILQEQRQAQGRAANLRQQLVKFDAAVELHRVSYQAMRKEPLDDAYGGESLVRNLCRKLAEQIGDTLEQRGSEAVIQEHQAELDPYGVAVPSRELLDDMDRAECVAHVSKLLLGRFDEQLGRMPQGADRCTFLRFLVLRAMDEVWAQHLDEMTSLRRGIHLRGHAKQDPYIVFQKEAFSLFEACVAEMHAQVRLLVLSWHEPGQEAQGLAA